MRVEELAERADVSVDTIRFYQKRQLLDPPAREGRVAWYGADHLDRLARIRELRAQGLTLALIGRVLSGDLDATDAPLRGRGGGRRGARGVPLARRAGRAIGRAEPRCSRRWPARA